MYTLSIPSPPHNIWWLGPFPIRAYAICILIGIGLAIWLGTKRYVAKGGKADDLYDMALVAVPVGIIGGRTYHVLANADYYFSDRATTFEFLKIWQGGLGIWGAVIFGIASLWVMTRIKKLQLVHILDALAPGVLLAQAIGRLGNWFNQELFGGPTTLPWGLEISPLRTPPGYPAGTLFHPTFLYELIMNLIGVAIMLYLDKHLTLYAGQLSALYLMLYGTSRFICEQFRIDPTFIFFGQRLHAWFTLMMFIIGVGVFIYYRRKKQPNKLPSAPDISDKDVN